MNNYPKLTAEIWNYPYMPEEVNYVAVDKNGELWAYDEKPRKVCEQWGVTSVQSILKRWIKAT